eukprot:5049995-Prorocentrum_lima.AAC.1
MSAPMSGRSARMTAGRCRSTHCKLALGGLSWTAMFGTSSWMVRGGTSATLVVRLVPGPSA